jgi:hypothetical protein
MKRPALMLFLLAISSLAMSQAKTKVSDMPYSGAPCTASGGVGPSARQVASFKQFDTDLRSALKRNDAGALAFLVSFPLKVNTSKGELLIPDSKSLSGHYAEIFTAGVRERVLGTTPDDYICRYDQGVAYADGVVWASTDDHKFTLTAVNSPGEAATSRGPALIYGCETKTHRIMVDGVKGDNYRYRSWNKPKPLGGSPDVELTHGTIDIQGTGVCAYPVYTFTSKDVVYAVQTAMGCTDGNEPKKATGHLNVSIGGKQVTDVYCF